MTRNVARQGGDTTSIKIDPEFKALIPPLSPEEFAQLEENCVRDGIRDPLVFWSVPNGDDILIDGHNRWEISAKHGGMPFEMKRMEFDLRDDVIAWIVNNQLGRRNLHPLDQERLLSVKREVLSRQAKKRMSDAGKGKEIFPDLKQQTRDIIGKEIGVSGRQVDKLHTINEKASEKTKQLVREGKLSINQAYNSVHEKRPDPVAKAKKEHEEFQEKKSHSVVSIQDAQIDKINQEIIGNVLYQDFLRLLNMVDKFGMTYTPGDLVDLRGMIKDDERKIFIDRCEMCMAIMQRITDNIRRYR